MTFAELCDQGPCLEELEGFREQYIKDAKWTDADQHDFLIWQDRLKRGLEVPAPSRLGRKYEYKRGKKPKLKRGMRA